MTTGIDPDYFLGRSAEETRRLIDQAAIYDRYTLQMLEDAGIGSGMKVLDVGSGAGDVAMLAARRVGPAGTVVGIDVDPEVLVIARQRADSVGLTNVTFMQGDFRTAGLPDDFDAAIGRLVLMYAPDPAAALKSVAAHVRPGGVVAFEDVDVRLWSIDEQAMPLLKRISRLPGDVATGSGAHPDVGQRLHAAFMDAGLGVPMMSGFIPLGGGADWPGYAYLAAGIQNMLPTIERLGLATRAELEVETLATRLEEEVARSRLPMLCPPHISAWARRPDVGASGDS